MFGQTVRWAAWTATSMSSIFFLAVPSFADAFEPWRE